MYNFFQNTYRGLIRELRYPRIYEISEIGKITKIFNKISFYFKIVTVKTLDHSYSDWRVVKQYKPVSLAACYASIPADMPRRYPSLPSACYVYSNQRMICRINSRKVYHYVFLELREIGIGNFQILSMLFSYLHVAFPRSLGHGDSATCCLCRRPEGNVLSSTCLLRLFEISLANDRTEIVVFSFHAGKSILKLRFECNDASAAASTDPKK